MPLKVNIGISKKVGTPNYGSRGASVNLEMELCASLIDDPERLRERLQQLFALAKTSVTLELAGERPEGEKPTNGRARADTNGGDGPRDARPATPSQLRAIRLLARRHEIDLGQLLVSRYEIETAENLLLKQASELIDYLQGLAEEVRNGS